MRLLAFFGGLFLLFCSSGAFAKWLEASSDHFLIYADDSAKDVTRFAQKLERYRAAMSMIYPARAGKPSPSNRVTVYAVGSGAAVRELYGKVGKNARYVEGFYRAIAGGSLAIIGSVKPSAASDVTASERTLFHEYAHHYLMEGASYAVPPWYSEGFAEYFSTAKFESDGSVGVGLAAVHRGNELYHASQVSIGELLDTESYAGRKSRMYDNFYARSWLLFHYLFSDHARRNQLADYLTRLNAGESELAAASAVFGDLEALDKALKAYARQRSWKYLLLPAKSLSIGPVNVRELHEAEAAAMPIRIRSKRGVDAKLAQEVVTDARKVAGRYPDDPEVLAMLAEAEYDAGNDESAIAAADKALARNPAQINALVQKGYAMARKASKVVGTRDWTYVRRHFASINHIEHDHPIPLYYFYETYLEEGIEPTQNAIAGLEWALELAPYDGNVRMTAARQQIRDERYAQAVRTLGPLAYSPHAGDDNPALELLETARQKLETATAESAATASDSASTSAPTSVP
jgi:cytochrome c-type biogenesis protein CcmH/NrfG